MVLVDQCHRVAPTRFAFAVHKVVTSHALSQWVQSTGVDQAAVAGIAVVHAQWIVLRYSRQTVLQLYSSYTSTVATSRTRARSIVAPQLTVRSSILHIHDPLVVIHRSRGVPESCGKWVMIQGDAAGGVSGFRRDCGEAIDH